MNLIENRFYVIMLHYMIHINILCSRVVVLLSIVLLYNEFNMNSRIGNAQNTESYLSGSRNRLLR